MKSFQDALTETRGQTKITQQDLANALDVSVFTVQKWEQGRAVPSEQMQKLALDAIKAGMPLTKTK